MTASRPRTSVDDLNQLSRALDRINLPVVEVKEIQTPWRYVLGIGISFALAVSILAGAVAYLGAVYAMRHTDVQVAEAVEDRNAKIGEQQTAIDQYRLQQCVIVGGLPRPWSPEVTRLYNEVLRCPDITGVPAPLPSRR